MRHPILACVAMLGLCASGCASMLPKLEPPQLVLTHVVMGSGNLQQQQLQLTVHAINPNNRSVTVHSIECNLEVMGVAFAQGLTDAPFTLPALGETDITLNVTANLANVLLAMAGGRGHNTVDYRIYGQVHLEGGLVRTIPFDQKGRVRL